MKEKIMIAVPYLTNGGAERVASLWANFLADEGYQTTLLTYYPVDNEYALNSNVKRVNLYNSAKEHYAKIKVFRVLDKIKRVSKYLKANPQDLIIPFLSHSNILFSLANTGKAIVTQTIRCNPWADPENKIKRLIRDHFVKKEKSVIVQNEEQAEYFKQMKKVTKYVVCNPLNPGVLNLKKENYNKINRMVAVGRLCNQKNHKMMIDAVGILKDKYNYQCQLDIYGIGLNEEKLKNYIKEKDLVDLVCLKGRSNNIFEVETKYDLFLMTSEYEGFPNALLEAMALGMPVISTNCKTGPKDLIDNEKNGYLLDSFNPEDLADLIVKINDEKKLKQIGQQARIDMQKYSKENCMQQLKNCIDGLLKSREK